MPTDPMVLKQEIVRRNLSMLGAFVQVALKDEGTLSKESALPSRLLGCYLRLLELPPVSRASGRKWNRS